MIAGPLQLCQQELLGAGGDTRISFSSCLQNPSGACSWLNSAGRLMKVNLLGQRWERVKSGSRKANRRRWQSGRPWALMDIQVESKSNGGELNTESFGSQEGNCIRVATEQCSLSAGPPWIAAAVWGRSVKEPGNTYGRFLASVRMLTCPAIPTFSFWRGKLLHHSSLLCYIESWGSLKFINIYTKSILIWKRSSSL